jgi:hypothetical protein
MENIEYKIDSQSGLETVYTIPIVKKDIPHDIRNIILKKGKSYTGITFYNVYRGKKMVKQFYGEDAKDKAFAYILELESIHSN